MLRSPVQKSSPGFPWYQLMTTFSIKEDDMEQKKIFQVRDWFQNDAPSLRLKRTPPAGTPKAAATPAAAPDGTLIKILEL